MVNIEFTTGASTFKINSISLVRNFHSYVHGNKLRIVNAYDTRNELLSYTVYSDISVNGVVYGSVIELAEILSPILFLKKGGSDSGGVSTFSGNIITKVVPVQIDWTKDSIQQIVNFVNSREFGVLGTQRILFKGTRIIGEVETSNAVEFYYWEFKPGKGNYGLNGTPISGSHIEYISFVTNYQNNVINLGEIGTVPIEVYINDAGPFGINSSALNVLKATREGVAVNYIYVGNAISIGLGATQTVSSDYIDVNATPVNPPSSTGGLDVPLEDGLIPVSRADGSIVWEPKPSGEGSTSPNEVTQFIAGHQSGLTFQPYAKFIIDGVTGEDSRQLSADAANATLPRYDVFAIEKATKQIVIIKGTAADPRTYPIVDPLTHLDTGVFIDIPAGATQPAGITKNTIYSEGAEWTITADPAKFDTQNTANPKSGTKAIKTLQALTSQSNIAFEPASPIALTEGMEIHYNIANIAGGDHTWIVQGHDKNGRMISMGIGKPSNYDPAVTTYQFLATVAISTHQLVDIRKILFVAIDPNMEFYLDEITISGGSGTTSPDVTKEFVLAENKKLQDQIDNHEGRIQTLEASSGGSAPVAYATMADMYAAQANQVANGSYRVDDASGHPDVDAGRAWFDFKGATYGDHRDYILRSEEESLNLDAQLTAIENRLTALESVTAPIPRSGNFIVAATDHKKDNYCSAALIVTIPTNASVPIAVGFESHYWQTGTGAVTFSGASGVTINHDASELKEIASQYNAVTLKKIATDSWILIGALKKAA